MPKKPTAPDNAPPKIGGDGGNATRRDMTRSRMDAGDGSPSAVSHGSSTGWLQPFGAAASTQKNNADEAESRTKRRMTGGERETGESFIRQDEPGSKPFRGREPSRNEFGAGVLRNRHAFATRSS